MSDASEFVSHEDFKKLDIRIGTIVSAERVPDTEKLIKCAVDFGAPPEGLGIRTIISGIAAWREPEKLIGKQCPYVVNLKPRMIRDILSEGMLLAAGGDDAHALLHPDTEIPPGSRLG